MEERRIRVHLGITVNLGEYQSYRIDLEEESDIISGDDIEDHRKLLLDQLRKEIGAECSTLRKIMNGETDDKTSKQLRTALGVRR